MLPWSDWSHIDHWGEYFLIYREEGCNYGNFFIIDTVKLLQLFPHEGYPHLFWISSNSKVCRLNLEAERVALVLQVEAYMQVETEHIFHCDENFPRDSSWPCATEFL